MIKRLQTWLEDNIFATANGPSPRPALSPQLESNVPGLFIVGDLAGAPVIKLAMEQGYNVVKHIAGLPHVPAGDDVLDLIVVGAGAAGLNAGLAAQDRGLTCLCLEKEKVANTIESFPEGKWIYAEPNSVPPKGKLWLEGATKEDLVGRWQAIIQSSRLDVRTDEPLESLSRSAGVFTVTTPKRTYRCRRIILATGQRGLPRKLGVEGEDQEPIYHRLYSPRLYKGESILVVGGGNSAVEAALTLSERNSVTLSYRGSEFTRLFKDNREGLQRAVAEGRIETVLNSNIVRFGQREAVLSIESKSDERVVRFDHAFVLIGAEVPVQFLRSLGIRMENEWGGSLLRSAALCAAVLAGLWICGGESLLGQGEMLAGGLLAAAAAGLLVYFGSRRDRWAWLAISFMICYSVYGIKVGKGQEFWPFRNWGYETLSFYDRPWSFWYTVLYTGLMTVFGLQALKRWGLDTKDRFQVYRFASLLGFQWVFFFLIPEILFQWAVKYQWIGELVGDPAFADQAWRSYGIVYAWPLFFYTFFYNPHHIWVLWGVLLSFVIIPVAVIFIGKRYCSWICGCGGLAETLGDRWRHLAPKGKTAIRLESMNLGILALATVVTLLMLGKDAWGLFSHQADASIAIYRMGVDVWLVGLLPVTLYPFLGGKIWCRYWCPLAKMMDLMSKFYTKLGISRYHIASNEKCISCNECSRNCLVGIDVMSYAMKQEVLDNGNSSCIGCGICVTVCPMDVLYFDAHPEVPKA